MLIGAINAFNDTANSVKSQLTGEYGPVPDTALAYKGSSGSIIVGDENYGEGSSREHAAMEPRYLGVKAVIAKSFARIHETNLKKQGMLPLLFVDPSDYEKIQEADKIDIVGLKTLSPQQNLEARFLHSDGSEDTIELRHTMNKGQIAWFKAGSALNLIRQQ